MLHYVLETILPLKPFSFCTGAQQHAKAPMLLMLHAKHATLVP